MVGLCEAKKKAEMRDPIWEVGEKGALLATRRHKMHKRQQKMAKNALFLAFPLVDRGGFYALFP